MKFGKKMKIFANYLLQGFGYRTIHDFMTTVFKGFYLFDLKIYLAVSIGLGTIREFIVVSSGLDIVFWIAFVFLILAEWQTGIKVDLIKRNKKFESRKFGRMILKISVYISIFVMLNQFALSTKKLVFEGFELNPFGWLFYVVVTAITFQILISYLENLGNLGYREAKGIAGIVLKKYDKWFEFSGESNGDKIEEKDNDQIQG